MTRSRYLVPRLVGVTILLGLVIASMTPAGAQTTNVARLRIVHVGIDSPPVDVTVNDESIAEGLFWLETTDYIDVPPGDNEIVIFDPGTSLDEPLVSASVTAETGTSYSAVLTGELPEPQIVLLVDGDTAGVDAGMGAVRVFHSVPDAGPIDAVTSDGTALAEGLEGMTASDYLMVAPGTYDIEFREAGTENVYYTETGVTIEEGEFQTVYLSGFADFDNFAAETFIDESGETADDGGPTATAEPTGEPEATPTGEPGTTPTPAATGEPEATATPEPEPTATATPTPAPAMPATGAGGMATGGSGSGLVLAASLAMLCLTAGGGLLYWTRRTA